jgi:hypothetical protein
MYFSIPFFTLMKCFSSISREHSRAFSHTQEGIVMRENRVDGGAQMTSITTKILAVLGIVAVIGIIGVSVVSADGVSSTSALSDGQMMTQGSGDCDQTQNMTKDQLRDGSCCENQELCGDGDMAQNQYQWSYQYQNSNQNGCEEDVETLGGDQVQNQNEWSWQYEWAHQYSGDTPEE